LAAALAQREQVAQAISEVETALALNPTYAISRFLRARTARSADPTYLAQLASILEAPRARVPGS
jgi:hypothetical protein